jgi:hypothetical protein
MDTIGLAIAYEALYQRYRKASRALNGKTLLKRTTFAKLGMAKHYLLAYCNCERATAH